MYLFVVWSLHVDQGFLDPLENCLGLHRVVKGIKHSQGALQLSKSLSVVWYFVGFGALCIVIELAAMLSI